MYEYVFSRPPTEKHIFIYRINSFSWFFAPPRYARVRCEPFIEELSRSPVKRAHSLYPVLAGHSNDRSLSIRQPTTESLHSYHLLSLSEARQEGAAEHFFGVGNTMLGKPSRGRVCVCV